MKLRYAAACALACLSLAGPALADGVVHATLDQPLAKPGKLIAAHSVWTCAGESCVAGVTLSNGETVDACQDLVKQVGPVSAYVGEHRTLDAAALAHCNAVARAPAGTTTASR